MKRGRSLLDVADAIDELLASRPVYAVSPSPTRSSERSTASSPNESETESVGKAARAGESAFGADLSRFSRAEEAAADMCLFLARAAAAHPTPASVLALVEHLSRNGAAAALDPLRRAGHLSGAMALLADAARGSGDGAALLLRVLCHALGHAFGHAGADARLVPPLLAHCRAAAAPTPAPAPSHWSGGGRSSFAARDWAAARRAVSALCGAEASAAALSLRALRALLFASADAAAALAAGGGLAAAVALAESPEAADALSLLEALTAHPALRALLLALADDLRAAAVALVGLVVRGAPMADAALRALTNVTALSPDALDGDAAGVQLAQWSAAAVSANGGECARRAFAMCCAINIVKWEGREGRWRFTAELVKPKGFLARLAADTFAAYHRAETEMNVLAGYGAFLLAVISLCHAPEAEPRVAVITAVAHATRGTEEGKKAEARPMKLIVAILQEFLLFQSEAASLTRDSLVEMTDIIDRVVRQNDIEVSSDG